MLFLLRTIRRKMLGNNKVTTYLLYAIGEIVLVVVGILIAVSIDDWKQDRANHIIEQNFYSTIQQELDRDQAKYQEQITFYTNRIDVLTWLLTRIRNPEIEFDPIEFGQHVEPLYYNENAISFDATFEAAKGSGAFNYFSNKELLKSTIQYYSEFAQLAEVITSTLRLIESTFEPLMSSTPKNYLSDLSSELVIAIGDNQSFYTLLGAIEDTRPNNAQRAIKEFMQKTEFESYVIGDLGRSYHAIARIHSRLERNDSLQLEITKFLKNP